MVFYLIDYMRCLVLHEVGYMTLLDSWRDMMEAFGENSPQRKLFPFFEEYAKAWCKVVQKYPRLVGIPIYGKAFVSQVCPPLGYPDPPYMPPPRHPQGQCEGVPYDIFLTIQRQFNDEPPVTYVSPRLRVWGQIEDIGIRQNPNRDTSFLEGYVTGYDENGESYTTTTPVGGVGFTGSLVYANVQRADGKPNDTDCYKPEDDLPEDPPINPDDFNPTVPFPRTDPDGNPAPPWYIPIEINLNPDVEFNLDLTINGDKYDIDFDGFSKRDKPPEITIPPKKKPGDDGVIESPDLTTEEEDVVEEEVEENEELLWVLVDITKNPFKGKTLLFANSQDNTYFAGYLSWLVNGQETYRMSEIPVRKRYSAFKAPEGVNGYRLVPVNGAILSARKYTQQLENN